MKYIKSGTKWLLFFLMVAALGALTSCAAERHAGMPAEPVLIEANPPGPNPDPTHPARLISGRPRPEIKTSLRDRLGPVVGAAFANARAENKLVFLDISSEWSAWPGEPGRFFPSDPETAEIIGKNYIPVYNDADRRPDVYEQYGRGGLPSLSY